IKIYKLRMSAKIHFFNETHRKKQLILSPNNKRKQKRSCVKSMRMTQIVQIFTDKYTYKDFNRN
ncbi:MAG: hypothetical protein LBE13_16955, partial [Bacteroidales bacterium]|nr:hypothetical protein [Bacteroidales bacterium]